MVTSPETSTKIFFPRGWPMLTISIVSFNNFPQVQRCLQSIFVQRVDVTLEIIVVAYMFSTENLSSLRATFPHVKIIESNQLRGFSENHNCALRVAHGDSCLILNDDTYFDDDSLQILLDALEQYDEAAVVSPVILFPDGKIQALGREYFSIINWFLGGIRLKRVGAQENLHVPFETVELSGACFLIRTSVLRSLDYFDEYYFFCPEDVDLSTRIRKIGMKILVEPRAHIFHEDHVTAAVMRHAIYPVAKQGEFYFFKKHHGRIAEWVVRLLNIAICLGKLVYWTLRPLHPERAAFQLANWRNVKYGLQTIAPKDLFAMLSNHDNANGKL